jgi:hypothetical protein
MAKSEPGKKYGGHKESASHVAPRQDARAILIKVPKLRKIKARKKGG